MSIMNPPVTRLFVAAAVFIVPRGVMLLLKLEDVVTLNDITQPVVLESVQPLSVPANTLRKM